MIVIAAREELKDKLLLVREGLAKLPPAHYQTLKYLVSHLVRYVFIYLLSSVVDLGPNSSQGDQQTMRVTTSI